MCWDPSLLALRMQHPRQDRPRYRLSITLRCELRVSPPSPWLKQRWSQAHSHRKALPLHEQDIYLYEAGEGYLVRQWTAGMSTGGMSDGCPRGTRALRTHLS